MFFLGMCLQEQPPKSSRVLRVAFCVLMYSECPGGRGDGIFFLEH